MNRTSNYLGMLIVSALLAACTSHSINKPSLLQDAESFTADGVQAYNEAKWKNAQRLFSRALFLYQGIDHQQGVLESHINLAEVSLSMSDYSAASHYLDSATELVKQVDQSDYQQRVTLLYVQKALQQEKISEAESLLQALLPDFDQDIPLDIQDSIQLIAIANRTSIAFKKKQEELIWVQRYENALNKTTDKFPELEARLLRFKASWLLQQGDFQQAGSYLQQALTSYKTNLSRAGIAVTLLNLAQLSMAQEHWLNAKSYLNRSIAVYLTLKKKKRVIQVAEAQLEVESKLGNYKRREALSRWLADIKDKQTNLPVNRTEFERLLEKKRSQL